jgi:hypothetical protein
VALGDCELQQLVGQKNSGLGAVMPVSQQLLYEHRFLAGAPRCIEQLADGSQRDRKLAQQLDKIVALKKKDIAKVYWNATFGSPEFDKFFSLADGPVPLGGARTQPTAVANALHYLIALEGRIGNPEFEIASAEMEQQYKRLQSTRYGGSLLLSVDLLTRHLNLVAGLIERRLQTSPICPNENVSEEAQIMKNIFSNVYATDIQPYVARVHQEARKVLGLTQSFASSFEGQIPSQFVDYYQRILLIDRDNGIWIGFETAIKRHSDAWQALLTECNIPITAIS